MPRCCFPGCKKQNTSSHYFPRDEERSAEWVNFVRQYKPDFQPKPWSCLCGAHFEKSCFTHNVDLQESLGFLRRRHNLDNYAVPTLHHDEAAFSTEKLLKHAVVVSPKILLKGKSQKNILTVQSPSDKQPTTIEKQSFGPWRLSQRKTILLPNSAYASKNTKIAILKLPQVKRSQLAAGQSTETTFPIKVVPEPVVEFPKPKLTARKEKLAEKDAGTESVNVQLAMCRNNMYTLAKEMWRAKNAGVPKKASDSGELSLTYRDSLKRMTPEKLLETFSVRVVNSGFKCNLRCTMNRKACPFMISSPSMRECASVMNLHLKKHIECGMIGDEDDCRKLLEDEERISFGKTQCGDNPRNGKDAHMEIGEGEEKKAEGKKTKVLDEILQNAVKNLQEKLSKYNVSLPEQIDFMPQKSCTPSTQKMKPPCQFVKRDPLRKHLNPSRCRKYHKPAFKPNANLMLSPITRLNSRPKILLRKYKKTTDPGMPVITAIRGSLPREEDSPCFVQEDDLSPVNELPGSSTTVSEGMRKAETLLNSNGRDILQLTPRIDSDEVTSDVNDAFRVTFTPPRLADLANSVLLSDVQNAELEISEVSRDTSSPLITKQQTDFDELGITDGSEHTTDFLPPVNDCLHPLSSDITDLNCTIADTNPSLESGWGQSALKNNERTIEYAKQTFLGCLGLQETSLAATDVELNSTPKPKFRTRLQKKNAVLEKLCRKRHAAMTPKRLEMIMRSIKTSSLDKNTPKPCETTQKPATDRSLRHRPRNLFNTKQINSPAKKEIQNIKVYQLRRANLLKKRAHEQTKLSMHSPKPASSLRHSHRPIGEVIRMPEDGMLEIYEEEQRLVDELEEVEEERKTRREEIEKVKREEEERQRMEEEATKTLENTPLVDLLPPGKCVLRRRFMHLPERNSVSKKSRKLAPKSKEVLVNGNMVEIKQEHLSDSEEKSLSQESLSEERYELKPKKQTQTVSDMLFQRLQTISRPSEALQNCSSSEDETDSEDDKETEDSMDDDDEQNQDDSDHESEIIDITSISDNESSQKTEKDTKVLDHLSDHLYSKVVGTTSSTAKEEMREKTKQRGKANEYRAKSKRLKVTKETIKMRERAAEYVKRLRCIEKKMDEISAAGGELPQWDEDSLTCRICFQGHSSIKSLSNHYKIHSRFKPYKCDLCCKAFTRASGLNYHKMVHDNALRFKCDFCNRGFRHPSHYREHLNVHTGEEPFKCSVCNLRFKTSNSLRRHLRCKHRSGMRVCIADHMPNAAKPTDGAKKKEDTLTDTQDFSASSIESNSPPLPNSPCPSPPALPLKPFTFPHSGMMKLTLFPKNGLARARFITDNPRDNVDQNN